DLSGNGRSAFCGAAGLVLNPNPTNCPTPNQIPVNRLSPQAVAMLKLFPAPTTNGVQNNFVSSGSGPYIQNAFDTRVDYDLSQATQVFGRFSLARFSVSGKGIFGALGAVG